MINSLSTYVKRYIIFWFMVCKLMLNKLQNASSSHLEMYIVIHFWQRKSI